MDSGDHIIHTKQHNQWGPYHTKEYDMGPKYTQTLKRKKLMKNIVYNNIIKKEDYIILKHI